MMLDVSLMAPPSLVARIGNQSQDQHTVIFITNWTREV